MLECLQSLAVSGGQPYGDAMIVNVAYTLAFNTDLFPDAFSAWQVRPEAPKTWTNFKVSLTNQTAQQSGFHSANMMIEHHPY
jgi:hypothetical protein